MENAKDYWKKRLHGIAADNPLANHIKPVGSGTIAANSVFVIEGDLAHQLEKLSREREVSVFVTLLAAFKVLLYQYSGQDDICVVTSTPFFKNLLALRSVINSDHSFEQLLQQIN